MTLDYKYKKKTVAKHFFLYRPAGVWGVRRFIYTTPKADNKKPQIARTEWWEYVCGECLMGIRVCGIAIYKQPFRKTLETRIEVDIIIYISLILKATFVSIRHHRSLIENLQLPPSFSLQKLQVENGKCHRVHQQLTRNMLFWQ